MADSPPDRNERVQRYGRRAGVLVFALVVGGFTAICATEIIFQVWAPPVAASNVSCREGIHGLIRAVRRARHAAASGTGGERIMLDRFRRALEPEWSLRSALDRRCEGDRQAMQALAVVDELRYAEEGAVRYESADLAHRRRQVEALEHKMFGSAPAASGPVEKQQVPH